MVRSLGMPARGQSIVGRATVLFTLVTLLVAMVPQVALAAPLTTQSIADGATALGMANTMVGPGFTVSNATFTGNTQAGGTFAGGTGVVGFESGLLLSSGKIASVIAPNSGTYADTDFNNPGDADLDQLTDPEETNDAAVLEFDFVPVASLVEFQYVFASEEYPDWVGTGFNDVFGFYVNGTNCALVNEQPVTVNTINPDTNSAYFVKNYSPSVLQTSMNGLTTVLTCRAHVNRGETNHMKLAIADTRDYILDAAVFIKAGSLLIAAPTALEQVAGAASYGDTTATLKATLTETDLPLPGERVSFTLNGKAVCRTGATPANLPVCPTTDANGVATLTNVPIAAGLKVGNTPNAVCASYAGTVALEAAGPECGPLRIARRILWVKPVDQTVVLRQPTPTACTLELTNGSAFAPGDSWAALNLTQLRCSYSRSGNGPATEKVGAQYRITALGALSANYDVRYQPGTLRVVAP